MERIIIMHYDMDAFYASIEINRNPKLKNKPLVVGENIVTTASYEARKFGIHSAMKVSDAKLLCPKLIVIPVDKTEYIRISNEIHNLIFKITNKVEFVATDEGLSLIHIFLFMCCWINSYKYFSIYLCKIFL